MRYLARAFISATVLGLLLVASAWSYPVAKDQIIYISHGYGTTNGGEWKISDSSGEYLFTTFCLERDEYLDRNKPFIVGDISAMADNGGVNTNSGDPLSNETKWLFWHYIQEDLDNLVNGYTYNSNQGADALQRAIWKLEEEIVNTNDSLANQLISIAQANSAGFVEDVAVINLKWPNGCNGQDLLVAGDPYVPPQDEPVPEPSTFLLTGLGLLGAALIRRKMAK